MIPRDGPRASRHDSHPAQRVEGGGSCGGHAEDEQKLDRQQAQETARPLQLINERRAIRGPIQEAWKGTSGALSEADFGYF